MKARFAVVVGLLAALAVLVVFDLRARKALEAANADRNQIALRTAAVAREESSLAHEIEAAHARRTALLKSTAANAASGSASADAANPVGPGGQFAAIANSEDLRKLQVRAFVGEEQLQFAAVLRQLKASPTQLKSFDEIMAEYQEAVLDLTSTAKAQGITNPRDLAPLRREVVATRDARLQELFGDGYGTWQDAYRTQAVRATVQELLQQTFQSSGPLEPAQAQGLVDIVKRHAQSNAATAYDWDGIATDSATVLTGQKLEAFRTALQFRIFAEKMSAAAGRR